MCFSKTREYIFRRFLDISSKLIIQIASISNTGIYIFFVRTDKYCNIYLLLANTISHIFTLVSFIMYHGTPNISFSDSILERPKLLSDRLRFFLLYKCNILYGRNDSSNPTAARNLLCFIIISCPFLFFFFFLNILTLGCIPLNWKFELGNFTSIN